MPDDAAAELAGVGPGDGDAAKRTNAVTAVINDRGVRRSIAYEAWPFKCPS
jgi:hypothetical protein